MYRIKTKDVYEDFRSNKEKFDRSNYLTKSKYTKSKYFDNLNKLVIGKIKAEIIGVEITKYWIEAKNVFILSRLYRI